MQLAAVLQSVRALAPKATVASGISDDGAGMRELLQAVVGEGGHDHLRRLREGRAAVAACADLVSTPAHAAQLSRRSRGLRRALQALADAGVLR